MRDRADRFEAANAVIVGASFDQPYENKAFAQLQEFDYPLVSDVDRAVGTQYEAAREPEHQYAAYALRVAYLIDPDGVIQRAYEVTDVAAFADEALADLEALQGE